MIGLLWLLASFAPLSAEDWPEWRGSGRHGVWNETGLIQKIPSGGLPVSWRVPVRGGYTGPAVARGKVFVTDYAEGIERALAFEESTGKLLWKTEWPVRYGSLQYAGGPRATPTVDGDRVYTLGAMGELRCLRVSDGVTLWRRDFRSSFQTDLPPWGTAPAPLVHGRKLIVAAGGRPDGKLLALDKFTGQELWRALSSLESGPGYSQPVLAPDGRHLVYWHAGGLALIELETGKPAWEHSYPIRFETPIATPVLSGPHVLVSAFFQGARLLRLDNGELIWRGNSTNELQTETLHSAVSTPVIDGDYIYGVCAFGQLRCLRLATGERVWETMALTQEKARYSMAFLVRNGSRYFFHTDRGDLVMGTLAPSGYTETGRAPLIRPTSTPGGRRERGAVNWVHPAYANGHVIVRNDEEMIRYSLRDPSQR